ncbi:NACHT domain-containing protein [Ammoniphilus sp. YIM 78166]|uniref:NACHT domain-containing protein n=1 Tax=Ammoniphilus sp. YIM 78166 TaxID=1644106 RepID=UPI00106FB7C5|nr:NACHT domain-containing protein [Ammoniphilus sp. YIM 78166]
MDIEVLIKEIQKHHIVSETEVRTKVAIPIFQALGYSDYNRAEEFPIYGYDGRKQLNTKFADLLYFNSSEYNKHRSREERHWVKDHSLLIVELKKPTESMEAQGQAEFYSMWARAPFYVITNGNEFAAYLVESNFNDTLILQCRVEELPKYWHVMNQWLNREVVEKYCEKHQRILDHEWIYEDYINVSIIGLGAQLQDALARTLSNNQNRTSFAFPIKLSGKIDGESFWSEPYTRLLQAQNPVVVLAEPGGGKTYLLQMIARELLNSHVVKSSSPIPVFLSAKYWNRSFKSIIEGIYNELYPLLPTITISAVAEDFRKGSYILLVDGLDEVMDSADTLYQELLKYAQIPGIHIIVTCRIHRYHEELRERFSTCTLDPLTNDQVENYAKDVLGENRFLYRVGSSIANLVQNPLFLYMTVQVMKHSPNGELPNNRAELYSIYTRFLLSEWNKSKALSDNLLGQATKEKILSGYAVRTFRKGGDHHIFNEIICTYFSLDRLEDVNEYLLNSGILRLDRYGPEFYHPSFHEYYVALYYANQPEEEIMEFIQNHHNNRSYKESFVFLAGILREEDRQSLLLDYLEENNLYLFRLCLQGRFKRDEQIECYWPRDYVMKYLEQVKTSYYRIIKSHFSLLMDAFNPWKVTENSEDSAYNLAIEGSMDPTIPAVYYHFFLLPSDSEQPIIQVSTFRGSPRIGFPSKDGVTEIVPISLAFNDEYMFYDLRQSALGIDSAREVALAAVKRQLNKIIKGRMIFWGEDHALGCEYVENVLNNLSSMKLLPIPKDMVGLSLYTHKIEEIITVLQKYSNIRGFQYPSGVIKEINVPLMLFYLFRMKEQRVNIQDCLLPPPNISWEDIPDNECYVWSIWSDEQLCIRVGKFYDYFQQSYRQLVESCFPNLKHQLYFYQVGPVRFHATVYLKRDNEDGNAGGYVNLTWEPVPVGEDNTTYVQFNNKELQESYEAHTEEFQRIRRQLRELGRDFDLITTGGGTLIGSYLGTEDLLYKEVYEQLVKDLENLLGNF